MPTTTQISTLRLNVMTQEEYLLEVRKGTINENELYLIKEDDVEEATE